jgi:four helix bundle protein
MEDFTRLRVYQKARAFARNVYWTTRTFPAIERRLVEQLNDSSDSIGANIAEGCGRKDASHGNTELIRYCHHSFGSACESQHRIDVSLDRGLISENEHRALMAELLDIKADLGAFIGALKSRDRGKRSPYKKRSRTQDSPVETKPGDEPSKRDKPPS